MSPWKSRTVCLARLAILMVAPRMVASQQSGARTDSATAMIERIAQLEARVRRLDSVLTRPPEQRAAAPGVDARAGAQGFQVASADGRYAVRFRGYFQSDVRTALGVGATAIPRGFLLRRVRPIMEATIAKYADVRIMPDFGSGVPTIYEAYMELRLPHAVTLRSGKFKPPVGLERLQSATDIAFIERANPNNLVPNRDVGTQLAADIGKSTIMLGVFNGVPDLGFGDVDTDRFKDVVGRLAIEPLRGRAKPANGELILAIAGSHGEHRGSASAPQLQTYRSPIQESFFRFRGDGTNAGTSVADGAQIRLSPQAYAAAGSLSLMAEYVASTQEVRRGATRENLRHTAWETTATFVLTGERASFRGVTPVKTFDPARHQWGAVELVARVTGLSIDDNAFPVLADPATQVSHAQTSGIGLNWHFAKGVKTMVDYTCTGYAGGAASGDRLPERNLSLRFQHAF